MVVDSLIMNLYLLSTILPSCRLPDLWLVFQWRGSVAVAVEEEFGLILGLASLYHCCVVCLEFTSLLLKTTTGTDAQCSQNRNCTQGCCCCKQLFRLMPQCLPEPEIEKLSQFDAAKTYQPQEATMSHQRLGYQ